ncbi:MAG TPA: hypothetical protein VHX65_14180 [Pirellulales bacterium]|jgi:hypothetical protein|nr:hypothetical protein [Pirellulales bacterium]
MMKGINRVSIVGWSLLLVGILLLAWQTASGGRPDWLFSVAITFLIAGSVLRVYGKYGPSRR